jgi:hypothetical protein
MDALSSHRQEILEHWYQLYLLHFGDERSLAQSEFFEVCGLDLDATTETLREGTFEQFVIRIRRIGVALAERRVPPKSSLRCICSKRAPSLPFPPESTLPSTGSSTR